MNMRKITLAAIILLAVSFTVSIIGAAQENQTSNATEDLVDDIAPYEGSIGPGHALYGLKIAFENIDETFTFNASEKLGKQVAHARQRIAEAKTELRNNNNEAANKALLQYREKTNSTEDFISRYTEHDSGLLHAQEMIVKHQYVLEQLLESHQNNTGLQIAYDNSRRLEAKFENKTEQKLERIETKEGRKILKATKKEKIEEKNDRDDIKEEIKIQAKTIGNDTQIDITIKFKSNSVENSTISQEILNKFQMGKDNISGLLRIENTGSGKLNDSLEAEADVKMNVSSVEAEYKFALNEINRTEIINGVYNKLSVLTEGDILKVLEIKFNRKEKEIKEDKKPKEPGIKEEGKSKKENNKEN